MGKGLQEAGVGNAFLDSIPTALYALAVTNEWEGLYDIKKFLYSKGKN